MSMDKDHTIILEAITSGKILRMEKKDANIVQIKIHRGYWDVTSLDEFGCPILTPGIRRSLDEWPERPAMKGRCLEGIAGEEPHAPAR